MKPVRPSEILSLDDYALEREAFRRRILAIKAPRRVQVGDHLTLLFENHDTVLYQIQEMLRIERISEPAAIAHELRTYNELVAGADELKATLLIEYSQADERDRWLRRLLGLERHLALEIEGRGRVPAVFDLRQLATDRISSVHYVSFPLGEAGAEALRAGAGVEVVVDHPHMEIRVALSEEQRAALREDLERG